MRIATHKIYRAFPELDRFDDERCSKFVRSANRGFYRRLLRWGMIGAGFWLVWIGVGYAFFLAYAALGFSPEVHRTAWVSFVGMGAPIVVGFTLAVLGALVLRDMLLRRRIRRVITMRGTCSECDYVLLGLNVGADLKVTCPECGSVTIADESMNELADGSNGQRVFSPPDADAAALLKPRKRWISKHTRRLILRGTLATAGLFVLGLCVLWLVVYLQTRSDIRAAKAELANVAEINAMLRAQRPKFLPPDAPSGSDEWDAIANRLIDIMSQAVSQIREELKPADPSSLLYVDWSWLYRRPQPDDDPENVEHLRRVAQIAFEQVQSEQIEQRLCRALTTSHGTVGILADQTLEEESKSTFPSLGKHRQFGRLLAFSLRDAYRQNDAERFQAVADAMCANVAHVSACPNFLCELIGTSLEATLFQGFREVLIDRPSAESVEAIRSAMSQYLTLPDRSWFVDSEAIFTRRHLAQEFASHHPNPVVNIWRDVQRGDDEHEPIFAMFGEKPPRWHQKGRLSKSIAESDRILSEFAEAIALEPHARKSRLVTSAPSSQRLVSLLVHHTPQITKVHDGRTVERRGLEIMLALESHRLDHGRYPDDLAQLAPQYLAQMPIDPYSGNPFRYRLLDQETDPHGRGYLLWSVGVDGTDDGGVAPLNDRRHEAISGGRTRSGGPVDLVINEPRD